MLAPLVAFALVAWLGESFRNQKSWPKLLLGSALGACTFYLVTNFVSWLSLGYPITIEGFTQAMWTGRPEAPTPTWAFFRNTLISTLLYTAFLLTWFRLPFTIPAKAKTAATATAAH